MLFSLLDAQGARLRTTLLKLILDDYSIAAAAGGGRKRGGGNFYTWTPGRPHQRKRSIHLNHNHIAH